MRTRLIIAAALILIVILAIFIFIGRDATEEQPLFTSTVYRNAGFGFELDFGDEFRLLERKEEMYEASYIPPCEPETAVVCIYYPKETFGNTNFGGAGFGVGVVRGPADEVECFDVATPVSSVQPHIRELSGIKYMVVAEADAAMSHRRSSLVHRTFRDGRCYAIDMRINSSVYDVFEPGTIDRFTPEMEARVLRELEGVLATFRFVN